MLQFGEDQRIDKVVTTGFRENRGTDIVFIGDTQKCQFVVVVIPHFDGRFARTGNIEAAEYIDVRPIDSVIVFDHRSNDPHWLGAIRGGFGNASEDADDGGSRL